MEVKLIWTLLALADLDHARDYIQQVGGSAASTLDRIERAVAALARHPQIGRAGRVDGTRELVVSGTPFILPYRVKQRRIEILAVLHAARRWPESF
ncbi:MAG: type II toxin-antitoxin system RelE/ParE family toxin [Elusimicrobia bacterium]|nr:type II toxin-antitoxin system RelE/ParE family toxin [Elusimicrobiota bacterium]